MRRALILISLISLVALGTDEILYGLLNITAQIQLKQFDNIVKLFALAALVVSIILLAVYVIRQVLATSRYLKKQGIGNVSNMALFRMKRKELQPYKREAWLETFLFIGLTLCMMIRPVVDLMLPYEEAASKTASLLHWAAILGCQACILTYVILSKDIAQSAEKSNSRRLAKKYSS